MPARPAPCGIHLVHDDGGSFGPLTDLRPAHDLRCGVATIAERLALRLGGTVRHAEVRPELRPIASQRWDSSDAAATLEQVVVHARLLSLGSLDGLAVGERRIAEDGTFVAARLAAGADAGAVRRMVDTAPSPADHRVVAEFATAPWSITARIGRTLEEDLPLRHGVHGFGACARRALRPDEGQSFGAHPIEIAPTATIGPLAVIDASKGPVVIGENATVRPLSVLVGPCVVHAGSIVAERALLKASTVIGPGCRVGGEIGATIFQGFSNKAHDGHLGDSFVGEWVNIGAGSDNSNLLNTYGEVIVRLEPDGGLLRTGRQFWGSVIGDHAKLAIGTRLMTGTTIGTGAMIAASRPPASIVPRFAWITDDAGGPKSFRIEKFLETARAMMSRRDARISPEHEKLLRDLHARATGA
jgi:UDP-N-acetylglucosamine diphosphorylase/glucosamine-1-phosphate N-acetyltransferase